MQNEPHRSRAHCHAQPHAHAWEGAGRSADARSSPCPTPPPPQGGVLKKLCRRRHRLPQLLARIRAASRVAGLRDAGRRGAPLQRLGRHCRSERALGLMQRLTTSAQATALTPTALTPTRRYPWFRAFSTSCCCVTTSRELARPTSAPSVRSTHAQGTMCIVSSRHFSHQWARRSRLPQGSSRTNLRCSYARMHGALSSLNNCTNVFMVKSPVTCAWGWLKRSVGNRCPLRRHADRHDCAVCACTPRARMAGVAGAVPKTPPSSCGAARPAG